MTFGKCWHSRRLLLPAILAAGCYGLRPSEVNTSETLALLVKVSDAGTGRPLPDAAVNIAPGRIGHLAGGASNRDGEFSLIHIFQSRGFDEPYPRYLVIEVWKHGYRTQVLTINTADYLRSVDDATFFKVLDVRMPAGKGTNRTDLTRAQKPAE